MFASCSFGGLRTCCQLSCDDFGIFLCLLEDLNKFKEQGESSPPHSANSVVGATEDSRCEPGAVCSQVHVSVCVCVCCEGAHSALSLTVPVINVTTLCSPCVMTIPVVYIHMTSLLMESNIIYCGVSEHLFL